DFRMAFVGVMLRPSEEAIADYFAGRRSELPLVDGPPLTARLLRSVPLGELEAAARRSLVESASTSLTHGRPTGRRRSTLEGVAAGLAVRPGRKGRSDFD